MPKQKRRKDWKTIIVTAFVIGVLEALANIYFHVPLYVCWIIGFVTALICPTPYIYE